MQGPTVKTSEMVVRMYVSGPLHLQCRRLFELNLLGPRAFNVGSTCTGAALRLTSDPKP